MKKIITLLFLLLAVASATRAQIGYQPLVRENVRWIYVETTLDHQTETSLMNFYAYEFRGDTIFSPDLFGFRYRYKKLYCYMLRSEFNPSYGQRYSESYPIIYMRESDKKVYIPNYYGTPENIAKGEVYYDFSGQDSAKVIASMYDHLLVSIPCQSTTTIDGISCRVFDSLIQEGDKYIFHNTVVEGVGYVGFDGDLLEPNTLGWLNTGMGSKEFVCLEDLDGNVLYKGDIFLYNKYIDKQYAPDLTGDGKVDVGDINAAVSAVMGVGDIAKADVNGDGSIDIADINAIINVMLNR